MHTPARVRLPWQYKPQYMFGFVFGLCSVWFVFVCVCVCVCDRLLLKETSNVVTFVVLSSLATRTHLGNLQQTRPNISTQPTITLQNEAQQIPTTHIKWNSQTHNKATTTSKSLHGHGKFLLEQSPARRPAPWITGLRRSSRLRKAAIIHETVGNGSDDLQNQPVQELSLFVNHEKTGKEYLAFLICNPNKFKFQIFLTIVKFICVRVQHQLLSHSHSVFSLFCEFFGLCVCVNCWSHTQEKIKLCWC